MLDIVCDHLIMIMIMIIVVYKNLKIFIAIIDFLSLLLFVGIDVV